MQDLTESLKDKKIKPWSIFLQGIIDWKTSWLKLAGLYLIFHLPIESAQIFVVPLPLKTGFLGILVGIVRWLFDTWVMASLILAAQAIQRKEQISLITAMKAPGRVFLKFISTVLLSSLIVGGISIVGLFLAAGLVVNFPKMQNVFLGSALFGSLIAICIAGAVYFAIRLALAQVSCASENSGPLVSIKTSFNLIKSRVNAVVAEFLLVMALYLLVLLPLFLFTMRAPAVLIIYQNMLTNSLVIPLTVCIFVMLYNKLKEVAS